MRIAALIGLFLLAACSKEEEGGGAQRGRGPVAVDAVAVGKVPVARTIDALGTLEAREQVSISSEINGIIDSIGFKEGGVVKFEGEKRPILIRLESRLLDLEVKNAEANLKVMEADLAQKKAVYDRKKMMFEEKAAPEAAYTDAKLAHDRALAAKAQAEAALDIARERLTKATIHAPIEGVLGERSVSPGDYIKSGDELVDIVAVDPIELSFSVPERFQSDLRTDLEVALECEAVPRKEDDPIKGKVFYVAPEVDPVTRTIRMKAVVPNAELLLRPGLFARVKLVVGAAEDSLVVPEEAIVPRSEKFFAYVVVDGKAVSREVRLGQRLPGKVVVLEGVKEGEMVVTAGLQRISDGCPVNVRPPKAAPRE